MKKITRVIFISTILLIGCSPSENNKDKESIIDSLQTDKNVQEEDISMKEYVLPSASQIAVIFNRANLKYVPEITCKIKKDNTGGSFENALRLGIYSADFFYNLLNNQVEISKNYFLKCREISEKLGLKGVFSEDLIKRIEKNIDKKDSIVYLLSKIQYDFDNQLSLENREYIIHISFVGAWIEGLHLAASTLKRDNNTAREKSYLITDQILIGGNIIHLLEKDKTAEPNVVQLIEIIQSLLKSFNDLDSIKKAQSEDADEFNITEKEVNTLIQSIEVAHQKIISI